MHVPTNTYKSKKKQTRKLLATVWFHLQLPIRDLNDTLHSLTQPYETTAILVHTLKFSEK